MRPQKSQNSARTSMRSSHELRRDLDLPESAYLKAWQRHFDAAFAKLQREYDRDPTEYPLMPEIEARLTSLSQPIAGR